MARYRVEDVSGIATAAALQALIESMSLEWDVVVIYERTNPRRVFMVLKKRQTSE